MTDLMELASRVEAGEEDRRILSRLDTTGACWLWTGALDARGRGRVWRKGKIELHHRAVWTILVGPIPAGALLCHHCDNPQCANPQHLYVGDSKTNSDDMFNRGRDWQSSDPERATAIARANGSRNDWVSGEHNPKAKLSERDVDAIRNSPAPNSDLAKLHSVHITTIQRIKRGSSWTARAHQGTAHVEQ